MEISCPHCGQRNRAPAARFGAEVSCGKCGESLLAAPLEIGMAELDELIKDSPRPVLVDFWAPWCGPCRSFAPTFKAAAAKSHGSVVFAKLDTEAHQAAGARFNIRSIPTLAAFHRGQELGRVSGALPAAQLDALVAQLREQTKGG